jgi:hypothetical protein
MRFALLLGVLAVAHPTTLARAQPSAPEVTAPAETAREAERHRHERLRNLYGAKVGFVNVWRDEGEGLEHMPELQVNFFIERTFFHDWLEVELAAGFAWHPEEANVPIDLIVKKPFHPTEDLSPYIGIGPVLNVQVEPFTQASGAAIFTVGLYWFFREEHGLDLDVSYSVGPRDGVVVHEVIVLAGPITRIAL